MKEINLVAMGSQNNIMTQKLSPKVSKSSDGFENFMNNAAQSKSNVESFNQTKSSKDSTEIKNADTSLGPEMKSTGEVLGISKDFNTAVYKAFVGSGIKIKENGNRHISAFKTFLLYKKQGND